MFARVKVPTEILPRFVTVDGPDGVGRPLLVPLEDVIAHHLDALFPGMEIVDYDVFRVTRDADLEVSDDAADLLQAVEDELRRRRFGEVVRVEVGAGCSERLREELGGLLGVAGRRGLPGRRAARHGRAVADRAACPATPSCATSRWSGITHPRLLRHEGERPDVIGAMREGDLLVHHPYDSFATSVERFVEQAVADPNVLAIKQTVYRTSDDSPLVPALIDATERGKQAVALVELQARFDERMNIHWAKALEEAGVHVVYGQPALKTHAKCVLVVRREGDGVRNYVHIGTGNYHSTTARLYTDFGLFTTDEQIGADVADMFNYLTGYGRPLHYRKVLIAPDYLRDGIIEQIERTIAAHSPESPGADRDEDERARRRPLHPRALRGLAGGRAGRPERARDLLPAPRRCPGISENIRVVSIVGRLLEHSRVYAFERDGEYTIYIASADLMPRNLDHRVELAVPVETPRSCAPSCSTRSNAPSPTTRARGSSTARASGTGAPRRPARSPATCSSSSRSCTRAAPASERAATAARRPGRRRPAAERGRRRSSRWPRLGQRVERRLELVDGLVVEPQQVVVAVADDALLVDHDHRALGPERGREGAVGLRDRAVHVRQQRHVEAVLRDEALVRVEILRGDAHDGRVERGEVIGAVAVGAELFRAHRRVVARVEQQHDALAAVLGELEGALGALQLEVGCLLAHLRGLVAIPSPFDGLNGGYVCCATAVAQSRLPFSI